MVTVQPAELLPHPAIENRFAMSRMPAGVMLSYGLCSECPDQLNCMKRVQSIKKSVDENGRFALHAFFISASNEPSGHACMPLIFM